MATPRRDRVKIRVENVDYDVVGGEFGQILTAVKALPNRRYLGEQKVWLVGGSLAMARGQLENSGFTLEGGTPAPQGAAPLPAGGNDRLKIGGAGFRAVVTGASFQDMLAAVKEIPGRRFDGQTKHWLLPGTVTETKIYLEKKGLRLEDVTALTSPAKSSPAAPPPPTDIPPPPLDDPDRFFEDEPEFEEDPGFAPASWLAPPPAPAPAPAPRAPETRPARRDQIRVIVENRTLVVVGGTFKEMLAAVKEVPDRRFDGQTKHWLLPGDIGSVQQHLNAKGFRLEEG